MPQVIINGVDALIVTDTIPATAITEAIKTSVGMVEVSARTEKTGTIMETTAKKE